MKKIWCLALISLLCGCATDLPGVEVPSSAETGLNTDLRPDSKGHLRPDSKGNLRPDSKGERKMTSVVEGELQLTTEMVESLANQSFTLQNTSDFQAQADGQPLPLEILSEAQDSAGNKTLRYRVSEVPHGQNMVLEFDHPDLPLPLSRLLENLEADQQGIRVDLDSSALVLSLKELKAQGGKALKEYLKAELDALKQSDEVKALRDAFKANLKEAVAQRKKLLELEVIKGQLGEKISSLKSKGYGKTEAAEDNSKQPEDTTDTAQDKQPEDATDTAQDKQPEDATDTAQGKQPEDATMNAKSENAPVDKGKG